MEKEIRFLKQYKGYLIDLDGTMYRGEEVIQGASEFIHSLNSKDIPYLFITNNSTRTQLDVANKLNAMGIDATSHHVFTTSLATAKYIKQMKADARCMVIGEEGLYDALEKEGLTITDEKCDFVIMGLDRNITYQKLASACQAILNGASFISTNSDLAIPIENGFMPGNGALTSVLTMSTGRQPTFIGKPEKVIMDEALKVLGVDKSNTLMVGDNYQTDILAGINNGIDTLMVYTGVTTPEDYEKLDKKPTYHAENLQEWIKYI